jgi:hypothetical protein
MKPMTLAAVASASESTVRLNAWLACSHTVASACRRPRWYSDNLALAAAMV